MKRFFPFWLLSTVIAVCMPGCEKKAGGIRSNYPAADHDPQLTVLASSALPVIEAVRLYREKNQKPPANNDDFKEFLPPSTAVTGQGIQSWHYIPGEGGYRLYRKIGWDSALLYEQTNSSHHWTFDPGDGGPEKDVILTP